MGPCIWILQISLFAVLLNSDYISGLEPGNWATCQNNEAIATRSDTGKQMKALRDLLSNNNVDAYIIPSADVHLSEFVSDYDKRRQFISGFTGSSGTAVVTQSSAALWTDGRYFIQAESQLGCDWILMREGEPGVPTIAEWLGKEGVETVGASSNFFGNEEWPKLETALRGYGVTLGNKLWDYIDQIWANRPELPSNAINVYPLKYAGVSWQDKVRAVREEMVSKNVDALVITGLDETAWLFNLRGSDIKGFVNDPFFYSFAIIQPDSIRMYIRNHETQLTGNQTDPASGNVTLMSHLNTDETGSCSGGASMCVQVEEYDIAMVNRDVGTLARSDTTHKIWLSFFCNYAIYANIPREKVYIANTPAAMMKTQKNDVEVQGMTNSHIRDGAALARFMAKLEKGVRARENWTEMSAMTELARFRSLQDLARGDSFAAISSVGPNAAINHYFATSQTDRPITLDETYLLDSGGQYLDGTTDVTRTFLFGDPSDFVKECYTRVLMGHINLALAKWNKGLFGREIDAWARQPLLDVGLVYRHGTGHGIGHYLSVHEGPGRISNHHARFAWDVPLDEHMFFSDEPGYYQDGEFGVRLENIIYVKKIKTKYELPGVTMFGMETVTLFPYEPHLIDYSLLKEEQIDWLNKYNKMTLEKMGALLKEQGDIEAYNWVEQRTKHVSMTTASATQTCLNSVLIVTAMLFYHLFC